MTSGLRSRAHECPVELATASSLEPIPLILLISSALQRLFFPLQNTSTETTEKAHKMLTREKFMKNFKILSFVSKLKVLPLNVDCESGTIKPYSSSELRPYYVAFLLFVLHAVYVNFRLLQSLFDDTTARHHLILHFDVASCSFMVAGWYFIFFIRNPHVVTSVFNELFFMKEHDTLASVPAFAEANNRRRRLFQFSHSRQEYLALYVPEMAGLAFLFVLAALAYDPTMKQLLFTCLSEAYRHPLWFWVIFPEEAFFIFFCVCTPIFAMIMHMLFFEKIVGVLKQLRKSASRIDYNETVCIQDYRELRAAQVLLWLFNELNCHVIFTFKLFCLTICTTNGYSAVSHFSDNIIFGFMYYVVFIVLSMMYSILYEKAFMVPKMVKRTKILMRLRILKDTRMTPNFKSKMKRSLRSIPPCGVRVGHFHSLERLSTPVFADYVLRNVVGLLVMSNQKA